ncbi:HD domain-containing phosphohydrolase [Petrocella sp. FN5]|uniref:HD domain-containing phosphohydrolase n=1 Tax=Petrocella sp. FN5 TaxID=3032002 RepID=UPI0023DBCD01|nr:HD domain-containing phosphohydrolase [Petrocella sp. FN5]MDF1617941.1 diguanylate cyclase [Petrocella sp. FN5]
MDNRATREKMTKHKSNEYFTIYELKELQDTQEKFNKYSGLFNIVFDLSGTPVTKIKDQRDLFEDFIQRIKTQSNLFSSARSMVKIYFKDHLQVYLCKTSEKLYGVIDLMAHGKKVASWLVQDTYKIESKDSDFNLDPAKSSFITICHLLHLQIEQLEKQAILKMCIHYEKEKLEKSQQEKLSLYQSYEESLREKSNNLEEANAELEEINAVLEEEISEKVLAQEALKTVIETIENQVRDRTNELQEMNISLEEEIQERIKVESDLTKEKTFIEALLESLPGYLYVYNMEGKLIRWNKKHETMTGYSSDELAQMTLNQWFDENDFHKVQKAVEEVLETGYSEVEAKLKLKNGKKMDIVSNGVRLYIDNQTYFTGVGMDITEKKKAEENIIYLSYHDYLTGLYNRRFYEDYLKKLDVENSLPLTLMMADVNGLKLTNDAFGHETGDLLLLKVANILKKNCRKVDIVARMGGDEFILLLPSTDEEEVKNIIRAINSDISEDSSENIILSVSIGYAIKRDRHKSMIEVFREAEDDMYRNKVFVNASLRSRTIDLIINSLYEKNNREMFHSKRVGRICELMAEKMGLGEDEIKKISIAGLMHDIGKIGIGDMILNKVEALTHEEWKDVMRHSEIGYRILSSANEFSDIADFILAHHERWDGRGYPKGLKGEEIPIEARVITIADAYDAMTSDRSYRKGLSKSEAIEETIKCSGTQFDADLVRIFTEQVVELI